MFRFFITFIANTAGALAPLTAVLLPLVVGVMGMGVDVSFWMMNRRNLQAAADAAVIAGAWEIAYGFSEDFAEDAGLKEAVNNGFQDVAGNDYDMEFGEEGNNTTITATLTARDNKYFSAFLFEGDIYSTVAAATAIILPNNDFCMLSLAPTGAGALTFSGNITVDSPGCGLAVNSNDPGAALNVNGSSATITVGDVSTVGGISDEHDTISSTGENTGVPPFNDPYDDLELQPYTRCTNAQVNAGPVKVSDLPLAPDGNGVRVMCGGFLVKNNETVNAAQLPAGIYI